MDASAADVLSLRVMRCLLGARWCMARVRVSLFFACDAEASGTWYLNGYAGPEKALWRRGYPGLGVVGIVTASESHDLGAERVGLYVLREYGPWASL